MTQKQRAFTLLLCIIWMFTILLLAHGQVVKRNGVPNQDLDNPFDIVSDSFINDQQKATEPPFSGINNRHYDDPVHPSNGQQTEIPQSLQRQGSDYNEDSGQSAESNPIDQKQMKVPKTFQETVNIEDAEFRLTAGEQAQAHTLQGTGKIEDEMDISDSMPIEQKQIIKPTNIQGSGNTEETEFISSSDAQSDRPQTFQGTGNIEDEEYNSDSMPITGKQIKKANTFQGKGYIDGEEASDGHLVERDQALQGTGNIGDVVYDSEIRPLGGQLIQEAKAFQGKGYIDDEEESSKLSTNARRLAERAQTFQGTGNIEDEEFDSKLEPIAGQQIKKTVFQGKGYIEDDNFSKSKTNAGRLMERAQTFQETKSIEDEKYISDSMPLGERQIKKTKTFQGKGYIDDEETFKSGTSGGRLTERAQTFQGTGNIEDQEYSNDQMPIAGKQIQKTKTFQGKGYIDDFSNSETNGGRLQERDQTFQGTGNIEDQEYSNDQMPIAGKQIQKAKTFQGKGYIDDEQALSQSETHGGRLTERDQNFQGTGNIAGQEIRKTKAFRGKGYIEDEDSSKLEQIAGPLTERSQNFHGTGNIKDGDYSSESFAIAGRQIQNPNTFKGKGDTGETELIPIADAQFERAQTYPDTGSIEDEEKKSDSLPYAGRQIKNLKTFHGKGYIDDEESSSLATVTRQLSQRAQTFQGTGNIEDEEYNSELRPIAGQLKQEINTFPEKEYVDNDEVLEHRPVARSHTDKSTSFQRSRILGRQTSPLSTSCEVERLENADQYVPYCNDVSNETVPSFEVCVSKCCGTAGNSDSNVMNWDPATKYCICKGCPSAVPLVHQSVNYHFYIYPKLLTCEPVENTERLDNCSNSRHSRCQFKCQSGFHFAEASEDLEAECQLKLLGEHGNSQVLLMTWNPMPKCEPGAPSFERGKGEYFNEWPFDLWIIGPVLGAVVFVVAIAVVGISIRKRKRQGRTLLIEEKDDIEVDEVGGSDS